jgi:hypothetical protein
MGIVSACVRPILSANILKSKPDSGIRVLLRRDRSPKSGRETPERHPMWQDKKKANPDNLPVWPLQTHLPPQRHRKYTIF